MDEEVKQILARVRESASFEGVDFSDVNASATDGDNALHVIARLGDIAAAKILIKAGIDINKAGDLGYTPLHVACIKGNLEMVKILINAGADLFALSEGVPPFTAARVAGQDEICELLGSLMRQAQARDPKIRVKSRIAQLRKEITRLEAELAQP